MTKNIHITVSLIFLLLTISVVGCRKQPQQVRHLGEEQEMDSVTLAQLQFNQHMAEAANKGCYAMVEADSLQYTMDFFGFWYSKTIKTELDSVHKGENIELHLQIHEIGGELISDIKNNFTVGSGDLPLSIVRSLKMMRRGEQMRIIAPWYTAYGVEGTSIIKPYSNLLILITIEP